MALSIATTWGCADDAGQTIVEADEAAPATGPEAPPAWSGVTDTWTTLPAGPADGRTFPVEVWTGTELVIWGG